LTGVGTSACHTNTFRYVPFTSDRRNTATKQRTYNGGVKANGKVRPKTSQEGPEGEYRYMSTLSLTSELDEVGGRHAPAALPPGKETRYPLYRRRVGPRAGMDGCGKSRPHRDSTPGPSSPTALYRPIQRRCMNH